MGPRESKWNYPVYNYEWCPRVWSRRKELANLFVFHFNFDTHQEIVNFSVNNLLCTFNTWIYSINFLPCPRPCLPFVTILTLTRAVLGSDPAAFYSTLFFFYRNRCNYTTVHIFPAVDLRMPFSLSLLFAYLARLAPRLARLAPRLARLVPRLARLACVLVILLRCCGEQFEHDSIMKPPQLEGKEANSAKLAD